MTIAENLIRIKASLPEHVTLVAVSKTHTAEEIREAYNAGQRCFGENKAQEVAAKQPTLPGDTEWHFIGHLQSNKVKYIAPFVSVIHSVDSLKLLQVINREARKNNRVIHCLLQFHIAEEETKFGLSYDEAVGLLEVEECKTLRHVKIIGIMGMATFTDDISQVRKEFRQLKRYFEKLKAEYFPENSEFREVSMGMSDDFSVAIEEGSTMVRVGSSIFGQRCYM